MHVSTITHIATHAKHTYIASYVAVYYVAMYACMYVYVRDTAIQFQCHVY